MPFDPNTPRSRDEVLLQAIVSGDSSAMGDPRDREEEFVKAIADKETLPDYSEASEGDVLQIGADGPEWGAIPNELPLIAAGDAGKVLKVNSGETGVEWGAASSGKLYRHSMTFTSSDSGYTSFKARIDLYTYTSTAFTASTLYNYLNELPTMYSKRLLINGWYISSDVLYLIESCERSTTSGKFRVWFVNTTTGTGNNANMNLEVSDVVYEVV